MKGHNLWKPKLFIAKDKSFVSKIINYLIIMKRVKRFKYKIFKMYWFRANRRVE